VTKVLRDGVTFSSVIIARGWPSVGRKIIVGMDAPEHHRHRALVSSAFRSSTLARWEDSLVRRVVDDLIDEFPIAVLPNSQASTRSRFCQVIAGVLGLPEHDYVDSNSGQSASSTSRLTGTAQCNVPTSCAIT